VRDYASSSSCELIGGIVLCEHNERKERKKQEPLGCPRNRDLDARKARRPKAFAEPISIQCMIEKQGYRGIRSCDLYREIKPLSKNQSAGLSRSRSVTYDPSRFDGFFCSGICCVGAILSTGPELRRKSAMSFVL
jgi:hypothetical protein